MPKKIHFPENEHGVDLTWRDLVHRCVELYIASFVCQCRSEFAHARLLEMAADTMAKRLLEPGVRERYL